jgi:hypothetical protein
MHSSFLPKVHPGRKAGVFFFCMVFGKVHYPFPDTTP